MLKSEIRKKYQQLRQEQNDVTIQSIQQSIDQQILQWNRFSPDYFLSYQPLLSKNELSPKAFEKKWANAKVKLYPKVINATEMIAIEITDDTKYETNRWGILEPWGLKGADPTKIELVIIPLLAFDEKGFRVGYGKGYYDRFLQKCKPTVQKVGICAFPPIHAIDDIHIYDVSLNYCVTPEKIYEF